MSQVVPYRQATLIRSETYRATTDAEVAKAPPMSYLIERGCELVMESAYDDGRSWSFAGKKKDPRRAGIPSWCVQVWCAGYDAAERQMEAHANGASDALSAPHVPEA